MNSVRAMSSRWGWLVLALFPAWVVLRAEGVWRDYTTFGIERDITPFEVHLGELAHAALAIDIRSLAVRWRPIDVGAEPRELNLFVADEDGLAEDLPYSGRRAVAGAIDVDGVWLPMEARHRGDTYVHWGRPKRSWRVRLLDDDRVTGSRRFNINAPKYPEQLNNHLGYWLAADLGLLAPQSEAVALTVNGSCRGSHFLVEQPGAELLLRAGRTPGVLFSGELLGRDAWWGAPNDLFASTASWRRYQLGEQQMPEADRALDRLLLALRRPACEGSLAELAEVLDIEQFARMSVFEQITQTHHFDHFHNWRLHWDPTRRRLEPIVWDPVGWQQNMLPAADRGIDLQPVFTILHARLHAHAGFLAARDGVLLDWFARARDQALVAQLGRCLAIDRRARARDPWPWPLDDQQIAEAQRVFAAGIEAVLAELRSRWVDKPPTVKWCASPGEVLVEVMGPRCVRGIRVKLSSAEVPRRVAVHVARPDGSDEAIDLAGYWRVVDGVLFSSLVLVPATTTELSRRAGGHPGRNHRQIATATTYRITADGVDLGAAHEVGPDDGSGVAWPRADELASAPVVGLWCLGSLRK